MNENYYQNVLSSAPRAKAFTVDANILAHLPEGAEFIRSQGHSGSHWNETGYIEFRTQDSAVQRWFVKIASGDRGRAMLEGEFQSIVEICKVVPNSAPQPLFVGTCADPQRHYFICEFFDLDLSLPDVKSFAETIAQLHQGGTSPNGKFGFPVTTYNGTLEAYTSWTDSWVEFFSKGTKQLLELEVQARGPNQELGRLSKNLLDTVIPRLLGPLEAEGRRVKPCLIHGDLWIGNIATNVQTGRPVVFDPASYWGHNEYDLSPMRLVDNQWSRDVMKAYHDIIPKAEPVEEWDMRNALYALRTFIIGSALYPNDPRYRQRLIKEMRRVVEQCPQ